MWWNWNELDRLIGIVCVWFNISICLYSRQGTHLVLQQLPHFSSSQRPCAPPVTFENWLPATILAPCYPLSQKLLVQTQEILRIWSCRIVDIRFWMLATVRGPHRRSAHQLLRRYLWKQSARCTGHFRNWSLARKSQATWITTRVLNM